MKSAPQEKSEPDRPTLADAIVRIGAAARDLSDSGINRKGVVALLHDHSKVSKRTIELVLDSLSDLAREYTRKP
jgi:hypothetical protein